MAQFQITTVNGILILGTQENTGSAGNLWYDPVENVVKYSYLSGSILVKSI